MLSILSNLDFWSATCGLIGTILIFCFGLPPKIDPDGHQHLITEQIDEDEKNKAAIYKKIGYLGLSLLILSFGLQALKIISGSHSNTNRENMYRHHYFKGMYRERGYR